MWRQRLTRKRVLIPVGLLALYALLGFVVLPRVVRAQLLERLPVLLKRPTTVGDVRFNPFGLVLEVDALEVQGRAGDPFVAFDRLLVDLAFFELVRGHVGFDAISLQRPRVSLSLLRDGSLSIADLVGGDEKKEPAQPEAAKTGGGVTIVVRDFVLADGEATFNDLARAEPFHATLKPLSLHLKDFTTETGRGSTYDFTAKLGNATLTYSGSFSATPFRSSGSLSMQGIRLEGFTPYVREQTRLSVTSGSLGVTGKYALDASTPPLQFRLEDVGVTVDGLAIAGDDEPELPFELGQLAVRVPLVDLAKREVQVGEVVLRKGAVRVRRLADGTVSLARLASRGAAPVVTADAGVELDAGAGATPVMTVAARSPAATPDGGTPAPAVEPEAPPWRASLARFALEQFTVDWKDAVPATPVSCGLEGLDFEVRDLRWPLGGEVGLGGGFTWRDGGRFSLEGRVTPRPLKADVKLGLAAFQLKPLDGYVKQALDGTLERAALHATLAVALDDAAGVRTAKGDVRLADLQVLDADDRPVLSAREIALRELSASLGKAIEAQAAALKLSGVAARLEVGADGVLNLSKLSKPPAPGAPPPAPTPSEPAPEPRVSLGALELDDVGVTWLDRTTAPNFSSALTRLSGKVTRITWPVREKMGVSLGARVDAAPLKVNGTVRPNGKDSVAVVNLSLDGYDLPHVTPYSVKYVAQPIEKGKLSLELKYTLQQRNLDAQNHVVVDQLEFGDKVPEPGPDATSLPLGLAVAVLSDRDGRIDLELPITGDLNEPDFHYGKAVLATLKNLLVKVATAPFSLLSGLLGGGDAEAMRAAAFTPGTATLADGEDAKVGQLAGVLTQRPRLKLDLVAGVDPVLDREALARAELYRQLSRGGKASAADGGLAWADPAQLEGLVRGAWRKARGGADAGVVAEPGLDEMTLQLAARVPVAPEALEALRRERATAVQNALVDRGVDAARVFIHEPGADEAPAARAEVEFRPK